MKNLIYFFLLFSTVVFSQNYNYGIDVPQKQILPVLPIVNNQLEEIEYFKAYLLPITKKATLQTALDTYGSVRLEKGDYSGVNIVMKSNQRLYGHPTLTKVSQITIASGSTNVVLENLFPADKKIIFQAGGVISNCTLKTIRYAYIVANNAMIENSLFINIQSEIHFDCSSSGYFRNNKFIRHQVSSPNINLLLKGNSNTPSYGNVHLWGNFLTPGGDTTAIDNLSSMNIVNLNVEGWNLSGLGTKPMLNMQNMGNVKISELTGVDYENGFYNPAPFNIDANELLFLNKGITVDSDAPLPVVGAKTNVITYKNTDANYVRGAGTVTGFDLRTHFNTKTDDSKTKEVTLDGVVQTTLIQNPEEITASILGTQYTPWARPTFETLPDPLGINWKTDRVGKPDSTSYIQNLINTKGIAELPEGIFYISSTLSIVKDGKKGIVGAGTGKTVICGLTDDFPLITLVQPVEGDQNFHLSYLTLQGGNVGVYSPDQVNQVAMVNLNYVIFRNQNYGMQFRWNYGLDNCFFNNLSFIDCNLGFFQDVNPDNSNGDYGYVDKVVFYHGQFLNCNIAFSMWADRSSGINAWIDCKFEGNKVLVRAQNVGYSMFANCDIINNTGSDYTIEADLSYYNCKFQNNTPKKATFLSKFTVIEGCNFLDNVKMFPEEIHHNASFYIINSTVTGNVTKTYGVNQASYVNSRLLANPTLSKMLVKVKDNVPTILINTTSKPYPQLLVTQ
jgi:hypothetical protein